MIGQRNLVLAGIRLAREGLAAELKDFSMKNVKIANFRFPLHIPTINRGSLKRSLGGRRQSDTILVV